MPLEGATLFPWGSGGGGRRAARLTTTPIGCLFLLPEVFSEGWRDSYFRSDSPTPFLIWPKSLAYVTPEYKNAESK